MPHYPPRSMAPKPTGPPTPQPVALSSLSPLPEKPLLCRACSLPITGHNFLVGTSGDTYHRECGVVTGTFKSTRQYDVVAVTQDQVRQIVREEINAAMVNLLQRLGKA